VKELSSYEYSPLKGGKHRPLPGLRQRLASILLVAAAETSPVASNGLNNEMHSSELTLEWAARPVALSTTTTA